MKSLSLAAKQGLVFFAAALPLVVVGFYFVFYFRGVAEESELRRATAEAFQKV